MQQQKLNLQVTSIMRPALLLPNCSTHGLFPECFSPFLGHVVLDFSIFFLPHNSWTPFQIVISFKHLLSHPWCWAWLLSSILAISSPLKPLNTDKYLFFFLFSELLSKHFTLSSNNGAYKLWFFFLTFTFGNHPPTHPTPPTASWQLVVGKKKNQNINFIGPE